MVRDGHTFHWPGGPTDEQRSSLEELAETYHLTIAWGPASALVFGPASAVRVVRLAVATWDNASLCVG